LSTAIRLRSPNPDAFIRSCTAGLDVDDELISVRRDAHLARRPAEGARGHKPLEEVALTFKRHGGVHAKACLAEDRQLELVPVEKTGGTLTDEQQRFRDAWLSSKAAR